MHTIKIDERLKLFMSGILLKIMIEFGYALCLSKIYFYWDMAIYLDVGKYLFSWFVVILILWISCYRIKHDLLGMANLFFLIFSYIPTISLWGIKKSITWGGIIATFIYCIFMMTGCFLIQNYKSKKNKKKDTEYQIFRKNDKSHFFIIKILSVAVLLFVIIFHQIYAPGRFMLSLDSALSARLEMREVSMPTIFNYLYMMLGCSVVPIMFVYCVDVKKYLYALINLLSSYFLYTINGMKTWIAVYILIIGVWVLYKLFHSEIKVIRMLTLGISALWGGSIACYITLQSRTILPFLHRIFTVPAEMHFYYYDFFQKNSFMYLRDSIARHIFGSPFDQTVSRMIGALYYSNADTNASNGLFSDFYANFGYIGLIIYPIAIFCCIKVLNNLLEGFSRFVRLSVLFVALMYLYDNPFFTWLLTGGYIVVLIVIYLIRKTKIGKT